LAWTVTASYCGTAPTWHRTSGSWCRCSKWAGFHTVHYRVIKQRDTSDRARTCSLPSLWTATTCSIRPPPMLSNPLTRLVGDLDSPVRSPKIPLNGSPCSRPIYSSSPTAHHADRLAVLQTGGKGGGIKGCRVRGWWQAAARFLVAPVRSGRQPGAD
jgi:hypothetical protein